jgi:TonB-linked SusC/RagA family outer membrane protein
MQGIFKSTLLGLAVFTCSAILAQQRPAGDSIITITKGASTNNTGLTVTGFIKDAATGKPLAAVSVSVPDFSGALTDDNGRFTIKVPDFQTTLIATGEGFQSKEIPLKGQRTVTASLYEESFNSIYDNAYLPTGPKPQNQVVNAIGSVNTEGNWNRSSETPESYLQGKVAGLQPIMRSGTPNVGAYLTLRGYNSLNATNQPLIIVDGMIYDISDIGNSLIGSHYTNALANIDVKDIENITVVKDAVSTYGTKAANGVILITTTHAKQLATKIDAAVYAGINFAPKRLPVMQSADYRTYLSDILKTRGWTPEQIQAQPYMNDNAANPDYYRYHNETDWQDQVFKNSSTSNLYMKVTGGDNIAKYALSIGYMKNAGVTKGTDLTKYNVRFNGDLNLSKRLTANANLSYTYYEQNLRDQGIAPKTNPIYLALIKAPFLNTNDVSDQGAISPNLAETDTLGISNPSAAVNTILNNSKVYRFFGSLNFRYQLSKSISIFSLVGVTVNQDREQTFVPRKGIATDTLSNAIATSRLGGQAKRFYSLYNDTYVNYSRTFNRKHKLDVRAGVRYLYSTNEQDYALGYNSPTDQFISVGTGVSLLRRTGGDLGKYNWLNTYLSGDYSLENKYFLSYNIAVDASSRFGSQIPKALKIGGTNMALMRSIGAAWIISSEDFMSTVNFIDLLKLRATYGETGNDDIGNYTAKETYVSQNLLGLQGLVRSNIGNPALQWETSTKANLGLDVALLKERLNVSVDVYENKTTNMLTYEPVNPASGYNFAITNGGGMKTTGIDVSVNGRIINTKSFKWDAGVVVAKYTNTITQLPGNSSFTTFGGATVITQVGSPANLFYGLKTNGVYSSDAEASADGLTKRTANAVYLPFKGGDVRFIDVNGDKVIDDNDRQVIGNPNPDFSGGITNRLSYKGFTLEALLTFSKGNELYNGVRATLESESNANNQLLSVLNRWRAPGQVTNIPKATWGDPMGNSTFSDRWIEDGSFLRMKELSLSYTIPFKTGSAIKASTIYITANNLFTITKYLGYDPEFMPTESILTRGIDVGLEPNFRSVIAGVRIGL